MEAPCVRVLLVDDDPATLHLIRCWLEADGYEVEVTEACDGLQALAAIEKQCPDFLVTDWDMPKVDGIELCRRLRAMNLPHYVNVLFLTGRSTTADIVLGLEAGADNFLTKPVNRDELLARLRSGTRVMDLERYLTRMSHTDHLTGLLTRRTFFDMLAKEWQRSTRLHLPLSCVMMDIDFFKRVNDVHGHLTGDTVIKAVGDLLKDTCRGSDTVCRYGGEEFCIMLPETDERQAMEWAERARRRLAALIVSAGSREIRVTGSFGTTGRHEDTQEPEELIDRADQALLCAKQSGRDCVVGYESLAENAELDLRGSGQHEDLFKGVAVRHVMTPLVTCLRRNETLGQAAAFFLRARINSAPVVEEQGKLIGVLSEKDLMAAMVSLDSWQLPVAEIMKPNVICYDEDTPIRTVYEFLCRVTIRRIIVVRDGIPVGTVSRGTLLRWFKNLVISKGLVEHKGHEEDEGLDPHPTKERMAKMASQLAHQATELRQRFGEDTEDVTPYVVGGATGMQELIDNLLALSRFVNRSGNFEPTSYTDSCTGQP